MSSRHFSFVRGIQAFHAVLASTLFCTTLWIQLISAFDPALAAQTVPAAVLPLAAIVVNIVATILARTRRHIPRPASWIRFVLVAGVVTWLLGSLSGFGSFLSRLVPTFWNLGPTIFCTTLFLLTMSIDKSWRIRESIMSLVDGLPHVELLQRLQQEHTRILAGYEAVKRNNRLQIWFISLYFVFSLVLAISGRPPVAPGLLTVCGAGLLISALVGLVLGNSYLDDHELLRHTSLQGLEQRVFRLLISLLMIVLAFAVGALFASDEPLIPPEALAAFFAWLASLFDDPSTKAGLTQVSRAFIEPPPPLPEVSTTEALAILERNEFLRNLFAIIQTAVLVLGIGALLWFVLVPILRKGGLRSLIQDLKSRAEAGIFVKMADAIRRFFAAIGSAFKSIFARTAPPPSVSTTEATADDILERYLRELRNRRRSELEIEVEKIPSGFIVAFRRYLEGFSLLGVSFLGTDTLRDIIRKIPQDAVTATDLAELAGSCADYVEAVLYSGREVPGHDAWLENIELWETVCREVARNREREQAETRDTSET